MPVLAAMVLALGLAACQGGLASEEAKDSEARVEHYETAAVTYYDGGKYAEAERMFAALLKERPGYKKARRGLARSKMMQGGAVKLREAQKDFEELVKLPWTHPERGDISYEVDSDLASTYMQLADLYDRDVRELDRDLRKDAVLNGARTRQRLQQQIQNRNDLLYKALPIWKRVLRKNESNPYALSGLSKANLQLGNDDEGIRYAEEYLRLTRTSQVRWREQLDGWVERAGAENVTRSQRGMFLEKVQGAREKEKKMHLLLASVHMRREDYPEAIKSYTETIRIDRSVPAAYIERAQAYAAMRQYTLAISDIEQYLKITDPEMHRNERVNAGELMQRYQAAVNRGLGLTRTGGVPAPRGGYASDPNAVPGGHSGWGSPGGGAPGYPTDVPAGGGFPAPGPTPGPAPAPEWTPPAPDPRGR